MVGSITSYGSPNLTQGMMARAVSPAAPAPRLRDRPQPPPAEHAGALVAFAPAAMSALIEAQERLTPETAPIVREQTARKIDSLIERMAGSPAPADASFGVRQLEAARQALSLAPVSFGGLDVRA